MLPKSVIVSEWQTKTLLKIANAIVEVSNDEDGEETLSIKEGAKAFAEAISFNEHDLERLNRVRKKLDVLHQEWEDEKASVHLTDAEKALIARALSTESPEHIVSVAFSKDVSYDFFGNIHDALGIDIYYTRSSGIEMKHTKMNCDGFILEGVVPGYFYKPKQDLGIDPALLLTEGGSDEDAEEGNVPDATDWDDIPF